MRAAVILRWMGMVAGLLTLLSTGVLAAAPPPAPLALTLADPGRDYPLGLHSALLVAPRRAGQPRLTLAEVRGPAWAGRFRPSPDQVPNVLNYNTDVWLRCELTNAAGPAAHWLLRSQMHVGANFDAYLVDRAGRVRYRQRARFAEPFAQTHAVAEVRYNLPLPLPPGEPLTLYLHPGHGLLRFVVVEEQWLNQEVRYRDVLAAIYFAVLAALALYNLLLFWSVRDRSYLYYVLFVLAFGLVQAEMTGYLQFWLRPWLRADLPGVVQQVLVALVAGLGILTARAFLETRRLVPRLDRALRVLLGLVGLVCVLQQWPATYALAGWLGVVVPLATVLGLLAAGVAVLRQGFRPARYYLAGWLLLMTAIVIYYLRTVGLLPLSFITEYGVRLASMLEVILLSIGLADRINLARRDKEQAQAQALAAARDKEAAQRQANQELRRAYDELHASLATTDHLTELDELKTRFFTNISHELRTPLTLILSPLEQMLTEPAPRPELRPMHRNARRLLHLISQLLDIARLEAGSMRLLAVPTDLARAARATFDAFAPLAQARQVALHFAAAPPPPGLAPLYADPEKLEQMLSNLLANALKFTPPGGRVGLAVGYADGAATLTVTDTGIGIAADELPRVFERFQQADAGRTRQHGGSGVGLALVRELAALHGGSIGASSAVGEGSAFCLRLALGTAHLQHHDLGPAPQPDPAPPTLAAPSRWAEAAAAELAPDPDLADDPPADPTLALPADERPLVLIVDDSADLRHYLRHCLQADYRLLLAADGTLGLARAQAALPDLIVSDLMMPGLDGLQLCQALKTDERTSHIPVVMLTALTNEASRLRGFEHGADDYLTKPFRPAELLARVRNLVDSRRQLRQRFAREVTLQPRDIAITSADEQFLTRALAVVEDNLTDAEFSAEAFANDMSMSRMHLHRKLKALTDQSATEFVRTLRLRRAAQLLAGHAGNVADVAYATGFGNLSHFSRCFREEFGQTPSAYAAAGVAG